MSTNDAFTEDQLERIRKFSSDSGSTRDLRTTLPNDEKEVKCIRCGEVFETSRRSKQSYCSKRCRPGRDGNPAGNRKESKCVSCGDWFEMDKTRGRAYCNCCSPVSKQT